MRRRCGAALFALLLAIGGCAMARHREQVRNGLLTRGLHRGAFLKEWGPPDRTFTRPAPERVLKVDPFTSSWQRPIWEVWEYRSRATCLVFEGVRLMAWDTDRSDCRPTAAELAPTTRKRLPSAYPPPP